MDDLTFVNLSLSIFIRQQRCFLKMAVRSNSLMPFSIQAILNKKEDSRHLPELDMCFSKTACWKIFGGIDTGSEDFTAACRSDEGACMASDQKSYDSDSGLSDDNDSKTLAVCKSEKDGDPASDVLEESLLEETDHESTVVDNAKGLSDCEPNASGNCTYICSMHCTVLYKIQ